MSSGPTPSRTIDLTDQFLIAMPNMRDDNFSGTVVYLCEHNANGALGLVINRPTELPLQELFEKVDLKLDRPDLSGSPVYFGGPVQTERGFVLHDAVTDDGEGVYASTLSIPGGLEMTTSRDVLEAMSLGAGPRRVFVSLGYASWAKGQLESEITENAWLTVEADPAIIFEAPVDQRYERAMGLLGLQPWMLSRDAGHA